MLAIDPVMPWHSDPAKPSIFMYTPLLGGRNCNYYKFLHTYHSLCEIPIRKHKVLYSHEEVGDSLTRAV